jgi:hypothetical protein
MLSGEQTELVTHSQLKEIKKRGCQFRSGETGSEPLSETHSLILFKFF